METKRELRDKVDALEKGLDLSLKVLERMHKALKRSNNNLANLSSRNKELERELAELRKKKVI